MKLINSQEPNMPQDLGALWREAERLGRVDVDHQFGEKEYRFQIRFDRRSGTTVWATGKSTEIEQAAALAIREALALGAQP